jgi:hypothetical protein
MERYIQRHNVYTLCKVEDPNWTVFHTNIHGEQLKQTREKYLARHKIGRFINVGYSDAEPDPASAMYYGKPPIGLLKRLQIAFGKSSIGPYWRSLKEQLSNWSRHGTNAVRKNRASQF